MVDIGIEYRFCKLQGPCLPPFSPIHKVLPCPVIGGQILVGLMDYLEVWFLEPRIPSVKGAEGEGEEDFIFSAGSYPRLPLWVAEHSFCPFWPCLQPSGSDPSTTNGSWIYGGSNINTTPEIRKWVLSCYPTSHERSRVWGRMQPAFLTRALCIQGLGKMKLCGSLDEQSGAQECGRGQWWGSQDDQTISCWLKKKSVVWSIQTHSIKRSSMCMTKEPTEKDAVR